ncbi:MAG: V-type ATP synthase subunit E family protein [Lawsonibacter sp.]
MEGIEKITAKILQDCQAEVDQLNAETEEKADAIARRPEAQADKGERRHPGPGPKAADERLERLSSAARMEKRKLELAAKQEVLGEAFELALDKLCALPEEEYIACSPVWRWRRPHRAGAADLLPQDRARVGKQVVIAANECLVKALPGPWPTPRWAPFWARWSTPPPPWSPAPACSPCRGDPAHPGRLCHAGRRCGDELRL